MTSLFRFGLTALFAFALVLAPLSPGTASAQTAANSVAVGTVPAASVWAWSAPNELADVKAELSELRSEVKALRELVQSRCPATTAAASFPAASGPPASAGFTTVCGPTGCYQVPIQQAGFTAGDCVGGCVNCPAGGCATAGACGSAGCGQPVTAGFQSGGFVQDGGRQRRGLFGGGGLFRGRARGGSCCGG